MRAYLPDGTQITKGTLEGQVIYQDGSIGYWPPDMILSVHPLDVTQAKADLKEQVFALRDHHIHKPVTDLLGRVWLYSREDEQRLANALLLGVAGVASQFPWKLADGSMIAASIDDLKTIAGVSSARTMQCFAIEQAKTAQIDAATTIKKLAAISISSGWPG
jgi:hypothetical protein